MKIDLSCPCGAHALFEDERGNYINTGGHADEKGRVFQIEKTAAVWLEHHKDCKASLVKEFFK